METVLPEALHLKLEGVINWIFDNEREEEWKLLSECLESNVLSHAAPSQYYGNMRAAHLQLLRGAYAKSLGGPTAVMAEPVRFFQMSQALSEIISGHPEHGEHVDGLATDYNNAYGSSSSEGIRMMARLMGTNLTGGTLPPNVEHALTEHMVSVWTNWITQLSGITGNRLPQNPGVASTTPRPQSSGCLLMLIIVTVPILLFLFDSII